MHQKLNRGRNRNTGTKKSFFGFYNFSLWILRFAIWMFVALVLAGIGTAVYYTLYELQVKISKLLLSKYIKITVYPFSFYNHISVKNI
jgi:hypothetical protein